MIRRLKRDVLKDLPDKQYEFTYIEADGAIKEVIRKEKMLDFDIQRDLKSPFSPIWGQISTVRREMGEAKLPQSILHLKYLLDVEEIDKLVIFSHHKSVMDGLKNALNGYGLVEVRGGMGNIAKDNAVQQFQTNPECRIFSGQLDAAGFGIDGLKNVASRVVFVEAAWVPGTCDQAVDRLHRIGQSYPVLAQFLVVEGSLDERVLSTVLDKAFTINEVLDQRRTA
jgi:SNF2 family DNA or RNA helicase